MNEDDDEDDGVIDSMNGNGEDEDEVEELWI